MQKCTACAYRHHPLPIPPHAVFSPATDYSGRHPLSLIAMQLNLVGSRGDASFPAGRRTPRSPVDKKAGTSAGSLGKAGSHKREKGDGACGTYSINQDGHKDGGCHLGPVVRVVDATDHLMVVVPEQQAEDGQDDNGKHGNDETLATQCVSKAGPSSAHGSEPTASSLGASTPNGRSRW